MKNSGELKDIEETDLMLGAFPEFEYTQHQLQLEKGDNIILYSDGVTEAMNEDENEFSLNKLKPLLIEQVPRPLQVLKSRSAPLGCE